MKMTNIKPYDPEIYNAIKLEEKRQQEGIELIPSENYVSAAVLEALGSVLTNKYSEGYIGKRYYGGCENIDIIEKLAIDRLKLLFGAEHANVQPLSGAPANIAAYFSILEPGDTILGMDLSHGGHLTHGHPVTFMSKIFNFIRYKTNHEGKIDLDNLEAMAKKFKPKLILVGYSAYSREIDYKNIKAIADKVGALTMADIAHIAGLIAAGEMNNPVPLFDLVTSTTHKTLRGPRGGIIMCKSGFAKQVDKSVFPGFQGGPHENNIAAKAIAFKEALEPGFKDYARQIKLNAKIFEAEFVKAGLKLMFGGTDNHLLLIDVTSKGLSGKEAQNALDKAGITCNKNMIPDDTRSPMDPSGIRIGTPAVTTRDMKENEMKLIASWIIDCIENHKKEEYLIEIKHRVKELCSQFPVPGIE
jgi:glycine hydroxymethyltransferase